MRIIELILCVGLHFVLALVFTGMGMKMLAYFNFRYFYEQVLFGLITGFVVVSYFSLIVGSIGLVYRPLFIALLGITLIFVHKEIFFIIKTLLKEAGGVSFKHIGLFNTILIIIFSLAVVCNLIFNFTPPTSSGETLCHLNYPKKWIEKHTIYSIPYNYDFFLTMIIDLVYLFVYAVGGMFAARMTHFFLGLLIAVSMYFFVKRFIGEKYSILAVTIWYLSPFVTEFSGVGDTDFGSVYFGLFSFWALINWIENDFETKWLILSALLCGCIFASKYTAIVSYIVMLFFPFYFSLKNAKCPKMSGFLYLIVSLLPFLPWGFRNLFMTGNPIYPFNYYYFVGNDSFRFFQGLAKPGIPSVFTYLLRDIFFGQFVYGPTPILLAFLPAVLFVNHDSHKRTLKLLLAAICMCLLAAYIFCIKFDFYMENVSRYMTQVYVFLSIVVAYGVHELMEQGRVRKLLISAVIVFSLVIPCLAINMYMGLRRIPYLTGRITFDNYISEEFHEPFAMDVIKFINANVLINQNILYIGYAYQPSFQFYLKQGVVHGTLPNLIFNKRMEPVIRFMKKNNISYICYIQSEGHSRPYFFSLEGFKEHFKIVYNKLPVEIYRVEL